MPRDEVHLEESQGEKERQAEMEKAQREAGRIGTSLTRLRENMIFQATLVFFFK